MAGGEPLPGTRQYDIVHRTNTSGQFPQNERTAAAAAGIPLNPGGPTPTIPLTPEEQANSPEARRYANMRHFIGDQGEVMVGNANAPINNGTGWMYQYGGDPTKGAVSIAPQKADEAFMHAWAAGQRAAPQADLTNANRALFLGAHSLGQAGDIGRQQQGLADLYQQAATGQGTSVAQQQLIQQSDAIQRQNLAMAAGGTGPSGTAGIVNATNANTLQQGQVNQQLAIQRAIEMENARQGLGNVLTGMRGQSATEAGQYGALGQIAGQQSLAQAGLQGQQNALNQQGEQYYYGQGANWIQGQAQLNAERNQANNNYMLGQQSAANQAQANANARAAAEQAHNDAILGAIVSGAATIGAGALTAVTGGAAAPLAVAAGANTAKKIADASSDVRAKTDIRPAATQIADAYRRIESGVSDPVVEYPYVSSDIRGKTEIAPADARTAEAYRGIAEANQQADEIRGAPTAYPAYGYEGVSTANDQARQIREARVEYPEPRSPFEPLSASAYYYKDPNAPGAESGQHFGPMAQELEKTPAGRSVVRQMPDGKKGIDTGRLALLNASETAQQRREIDALKNERAANVKAAESALRAPSYLALKRSNDRKEALLRSIASIGQTTQRALARPVYYPAPQQAAPVIAPVVAYRAPAPPQPMALPQQGYGY